MARILVVEDSPTLVSTVEIMLRKYGHDVLVARNGLTALSSVRVLAPELVLLDIMLPHVNGLEVCDIIKRNPAYKSLPIIIMSGLNHQEDLERAYDVGANAYIIKPFDEQHLIETVQQQLVAHYVA